MADNKNQNQGNTENKNQETPSVDLASVVATVESLQNQISALVVDFDQFGEMVGKSGGTIRNILRAANGVGRNGESIDPVDPFHIQSAAIEIGGKTRFLVAAAPIVKELIEANHGSVSFDSGLKVSDWKNLVRDASVEFPAQFKPDMFDGVKGGKNEYAKAFAKALNITENDADKRARELRNAIDQRRASRKSETFTFATE